MWRVCMEQTSNSGYKVGIVGSVSCHPGDLSSTADIARVVGEITDLHGPCELLCYNAGVWNESKAMEVGACCCSPGLSY